MRSGRATNAQCFPSPNGLSENGAGLVLWNESQRLSDLDPIAVYLLARLIQAGSDGVDPMPFGLDVLQTRTDRIRLLIAEQRPLLREGLRALLQLATEFEIVGEAENRQQAVRMVHRLGPDVVLVDVMPELDGGMATIRRIREQRPATRVVALCSAEPDNVVAVMRAGASGCVSLENRAHDLRHTINAAAAGRVELPSKLLARLLCERVPDAERSRGLSTRELEVLQLLATGLTNRRIGSALCISEKTVKNHVTNILSKLDVESRLEAALVARDMRRTAQAVYRMRDAAPSGMGCGDSGLMVDV